MFRKLRNKFLILNMVTISVMMLIAFGCIYVIMDRNISRDIDEGLRREYEVARKAAGIFGPSRSFPNNRQQESVPNEDTPDSRSAAFSILTDREASIQTVVPRFEMTAEFYNEAAAQALAGGKQQGTLKLGDTLWAYSVQTMQRGYLISFLDITSQEAFLKNLVYAFLLVASAMLGIIYLISRYFANRSIEPVREAFDKQKQFIADASHELKTPLSVINTNVDVLLGQADDTIANQSKWLAFIKSESERMAKLTNDLLYLAQMDQTNAAVMFVPFDVSDAVEQVVLTMEAVVFEHNLQLSYEIEPGLTARGSVEQFKQVVMILLDNALKYTTPNGSVDITLKKRQRTVMLTVTNTGEWIAEEHLERIFDRFYRTDPSRTRSQGGYGLGLAIAKAIIEQHKGSIYARNAKEQKVSFVVELPLAA